MADKKYKVADGVALTVKGVVLGAGEAIPQTDAGVNVLDADTIKTLVAAKKIVEDKEAAANAKDAEKAAKEAEKAAKEAEKKAKEEAAQNGDNGGNQQ